MSAAQPPKRLSHNLALDHASRARHKLIGGSIIAFAKASRAYCHEKTARLPAITLCTGRPVVAVSISWITSLPSRSVSA